MSFRIGMDLDGVLANFNESFRRKYIEVTQKDQFFEGPFINGFEPPCWNYPIESYGYTKAEDDLVWDAVRNDPQFWFRLAPLQGAEKVIHHLARLRREYGSDVYFLTTRAGVKAHRQSYDWVTYMGFSKPTVLLTDYKAGKGGAVKSLALTHVFDDKPENCWEIKEASPSTNVYLVSCRYNEWAQPQTIEKGIQIINNPSSVLGVL